MGVKVTIEREAEGLGAHAVFRRKLFLQPRASGNPKETEAVGFLCPCIFGTGSVEVRLEILYEIATMNR